MLERFTREARNVVRLAEREAQALGADAVRSEHLLVAVAERCAPVLVPPDPWRPPAVRLGRAPVTAESLRRLLSSEDPDAKALAALGISLADVRRRAEEAFGPGAWGPRSGRRIRFARDAKDALELALREAVALRIRRIGPLEILLGLLRQDGAAVRLLERSGVDPDELGQRVRATLAGVSRLALAGPTR